MINMDNIFAKPFRNIQKHIPKNQTGMFWIDCKDNISKMFITRNNAGKYVLYRLKDNKTKEIKQSQDCEKLQYEAEQEMKKG